MNKDLLCFGKFFPWRMKGFLVVKTFIDVQFGYA